MYAIWYFSRLHKQDGEGGDEDSFEAEAVCIDDAGPILPEIELEDRRSVAAIAKRVQTYKLILNYSLSHLSTTFFNFAFLHVQEASSRVYKSYARME